ncbi:hypothetical protein ASE41_09925 [Streptomyces sp. Root264]|nr:hypothetical protein ASE41_09925 [Streptomyces sp. Root264]
MVPGLRKHLYKIPPQAHRAVTDHEFGIAHAASAAVTQQIRPRLGRFTQPLGQRDNFLATVGAHPHEDQDAGVGLAEADLGVDAVGPHVDVVGILQVAGLEGGVVVGPLLRQPGHRRRREAGRAAQELLHAGTKSPEDSPWR